MAWRQDSAGCPRPLVLTRSAVAHSPCSLSSDHTGGRATASGPHQEAPSGSVKLLSPRPGESDFQVGIADPGDPTKTRKLPNFLHLGKNLGVSTSGSYERFIVWDNHRYSHIVDPATGIAASFRHAATIAAPSAAMADWMSTALYLDPALEAKFRERVPELNVVIVEP